jgi:glutamate racemase
MEPGEVGVARIGIFDSGLGGLSVWREIARLLPEHDTLYVADQANIPYGSRRAADIRRLSHGIARYAIDRGCDPVVVACNTASAAALATLRTAFVGVSFVGMEPAVKPAAATTRRRVVGILATPATFQGDLFTQTVERFAADVQVIRQVCPGLVERIESGEVEGPGMRGFLEAFLAPSLAAGADTIVLACTHYPFVSRSIEEIVGPEIRVIDAAPAVARQVGRLLAGSSSGPPGRHEFRTTGDPTQFERVASQLLQRSTPVGGVVWVGDELRDVRAPTSSSP